MATKMFVLCRKLDLFEKRPWNKERKEGSSSCYVSGFSKLDYIISNVPSNAYSFLEFGNPCVPFERLIEEAAAAGRMTLKWV